MILIINGHPSRNSFTAALADSYAEGARSSGAQVEVLHLGDLKFDPILHEGYRKVMPLESDLVRAQELIKWLKTATLDFCGFSPVKVKVIDRVRFLTEEQRRKKLLLAQKSGEIAAFGMA